MATLKLQKALHAKAKAEAEYRFYALDDKISRDTHGRCCTRHVRPRVVIRRSVKRLTDKVF